VNGERNILAHPSFDVNLDTTLVTHWATLAELRKQVSDVIPRVTVQTSAQTLLVKEMRNETNRSAKNEETVENTHLKVVFGFLGAEGARVSEKVDEADCHTAVYVENEVVLLAGCDRLNGKRVVEQLGRREIGQAVLLDERDTKIGVVS
jgi:hypothetical protein